MTPPDGWQGILDKDETILWQGRPDAKVVWKISHLFTFLFGLGFAGFALVWMTMAARSGGVFWMFGLIHFSVGLSLAFGTPFFSAWKRRHTWYTLTNHRAFVATDRPFVGRRLKSYPITAETPLTYDAGDPATIHFAHEFRRSRNRSTRRDIGFERIADGAEVYRLMRNAQRQRT
ncbi:MAG: aspartate carbamoyltransferase catalytic subunit [Rhodobacter sp.]|nr:aspartate carbamoyltransferase catalytic subunit [Rhodobacter sp.]